MPDPPSAAGAAARLVLSDIAYRKGASDEGRRHLEEATAAYRSTGAKQELGEVLIRLSRLALADGDSVSAQRFAAEAYKATRSPSHLPERGVK